LRQFDQALDEFDRAVEISPQSPFAHIWRARIYWLLGRAPEAIAEEKQAGTLAHSAQQLRDQGEVAAIYAKSGFRAARLKFVQLMERHYRGNYEAMWVAFQYGTIQDGPKVLQWLDEALRAQEAFPFHAKTAPEFDFLRGPAVSSSASAHRPAGMNSLGSDSESAREEFLRAYGTRPAWFAEEPMAR